MLNFLKKYCVEICFVAIAFISAISLVVVKNIFFTRYNYYVTYAYDTGNSVGLEGVQTNLNKPITQYADMSKMANGIREYMLKNNPDLEEQNKKQKINIVIVNYILLGKE
jgi:hypothetical protein